MSIPSGTCYSHRPALLVCILLLAFIEAAVSSVTPDRRQHSPKGSNASKVTILQYRLIVSLTPGYPSRKCINSPGREGWDRTEVPLATFIVPPLFRRFYTEHVSLECIMWNAYSEHAYKKKSSKEVPRAKRSTTYIDVSFFRNYFQFTVRHSPAIK